MLTWLTPMTPLSHATMIHQETRQVLRSFYPNGPWWPPVFATCAPGQGIVKPGMPGRGWIACTRRNSGPFFEQAGTLMGTNAGRVPNALVGAG